MSKGLSSQGTEPFTQGKAGRLQPHPQRPGHLPRGCVNTATGQQLAGSSQRREGGQPSRWTMGGRGHSLAAQRLLNTAPEALPFPGVRFKEIEVKDTKRNSLATSFMLLGEKCEGQDTVFPSAQTEAPDSGSGSWCAYPRGPAGPLGGDLGAQGSLQRRDCPKH